MDVAAGPRFGDGVFYGSTDSAGTICACQTSGANAINLEFIGTCESFANWLWEFRSSP
jgi:hypothetical protein